jgi:outer membrane protein assembly factor BamE
MRNLFDFIILSAFALVCLGVCSCTFPPRIYRMDIQQGNILTEDMTSCIKPGMSKTQVQEILGTPALAHTINNNRWDYYYSFKPGMGGQEITRHYTVFFKNDRVVGWE